MTRVKDLTPKPGQRLITPPPQSVDQICHPLNRRLFQFNAPSKCSFQKLVPLQFYLLLVIDNKQSLRMYCIDTEALVFMFNGGSSYGSTIHPIFTRICMLDLHALVI